MSFYGTKFWEEIQMVNLPYGMYGWCGHPISINKIELPNKYCWQLHEIKLLFSIQN